MSLHTNCHAPRTTLSGRIQIGHKGDLFNIYYYYSYYLLCSVNIKPPRHRFGLGLCMGLAIKPCPFQISNAHISNTFHSNPYCDIITFILERRQICIGFTLPLWIVDSRNEIGNQRLKTFTFYL